MCRSTPRSVPRPSSPRIRTATRSSPYRRCGRSGLMLPPISLGLWQNFGDDRPLGIPRAILRRAFDLGITHFDLANNYGPPYGSAEINFGRHHGRGLPAYRDELVISTKAGYDMWPGPYGDWGSRKYLLASLDQSLARMGLDYVDIFYSHRADPETPLEETMGALDAAVRQGKALYVGHLLLQPAADRGGDRDPAPPGHAAADPPAVLLDVQPVDRARAARRAGARGRRLHRLLAAGPGAVDQQVPGRRARGLAGAAGAALRRGAHHAENVARVRALNEIAARRGQSLAQMAIAWVLRDRRVTSALVGASSVAQLENTVGSPQNARLRRRRARRDRRVRRRRRAQHLAAVLKRGVARAGGGCGGFRRYFLHYPPRPRRDIRKPFRAATR